MGGLEAAYRAFWANRLLYGSDYTGYEPRAFVVRVETVIRDNSEREKVFASNLVRLLRQIDSRPVLPAGVAAASARE